ncbi:hypothetical protein GLW08_21220 [Pontibacillus yanchengensis]|uniref:Uncharacterized protein n=2 Tax=Pontibacillus yanchengensis TaxID=462910 RepID=A0ACC7VMP0_9BACI|nr:Rad52/Rad22 family DNA repair protein [Pontibacillus yanchengensis]MYL35516.1 hypothetical protein [Pontibacillus yanchengensis]MYL55824.1 hypothetical protein [Pontibacillus yanchengensis]
MEPLNMQEIKEKLSEPFSSQDLEWRTVHTFSNQNGPTAIVVPYVQSRAIMNRLDEVVGWDRWENEIKELPGGGVTQGIRIWISEERSIIKWDGADRTQVEPTKGAISGALKRSAILYNLGRYLYDLGEFRVKVTQQKSTQNDVRVNDKKQNIFGYFTPPQLPSNALPQHEQGSRSGQTSPQQNQGHEKPQQSTQGSIPPGFTECILDGLLPKDANGQRYYEIALMSNNNQSAVVYAIGKMAQKIEELSLEPKSKVAVKTSMHESGQAYVIDDIAKVG